MNRRPSRPARVAALLAVLGLLAFAASASASQISLKCGGAGPRNKDSAGTALCAAQPGKARVITGTLRDDANKPVAGKVAVTFGQWTPAPGGGFYIHYGKPTTIAANGAGKFSLPVKTATKVSIKFEAVADEALGISPVLAEAEVSRQLAVSVKKLGGGRVKVSVRGTSHALKVAILDESGYEVQGGKLRKASKRGVVVFSLGAAHGKLEVYVEVGELSDLFWEGRRPSFRL